MDVALPWLAESRSLDRMPHTVDDDLIFSIERPHSKLWTYYLLRSLAALPLFPILILPAWFRYHTLRYRFTPEGISMKWGILFRREIIIQYARIQDIHIHSNVIERWLGLARVLVQTASGNASAEMTLEGLQQFEVVRDFLYSRMRGVHSPAAAVSRHQHHEDSGHATQAIDAEIAATLREVAGELRSLRLAATAGKPSEKLDADHV